MTIWVVTVTREVSLAVHAATREQAEDVALSASWDGDLDWSSADEDTSAYELPPSARGWDDDVPLGLDDDDSRTVAEIRAGLPPPAVERAEWLARRPAEQTPAAILEWLGTAPPREGHDRRPWWGAVDGGAAASDGHAVAWAAGAPGPEGVELPSGTPWAEAYVPIAAHEHAGMAAEADSRDEEIARLRAEVARLRSDADVYDLELAGLRAARARVAETLGTGETADHVAAIEALRQSVDACDVCAGNGCEACGGSGRMSTRLHRVEQERDEARALVASWARRCNEGALVASLRRSADERESAAVAEGERRIEALAERVAYLEAAESLSGEGHLLAQTIEALGGDVPSIRVPERVRDLVAQRDGWRARALTAEQERDEWARRADEAREELSEWALAGAGVGVEAAAAVRALVEDRDACVRERDEACERQARTMRVLDGVREALSPVGRDDDTSIGQRAERVAQELMAVDVACERTEDEPSGADLVRLRLDALRATLDRYRLTVDECEQHEHESDDERIGVIVERFAAATADAQGLRDGLREALASRDEACDEADALRARVAELEAERDAAAMRAHDRIAERLGMVATDDTGRVGYVASVEEIGEVWDAKGRAQADLAELRGMLDPHRLVTEWQYHEGQGEPIEYESDADAIARLVAGYYPSATADLEALREQIAVLREQRDRLAAMEETRAVCCAEHEAEARRLRELVGFWERSSTARLLGIAPDQLEAVRGVLVVAEDVISAMPIAGRLDRLRERVEAYIEAGRPLGGDRPCSRCEGRGVVWYETIRPGGLPAYNDGPCPACGDRPLGGDRG